MQDDQKPDTGDAERITAQITGELCAKDEALRHDAPRLRRTTAAVHQIVSRQLRENAAAGTPGKPPALLLKLEGVLGQASRQQRNT